MTEPEIHFPVKCPICAQESLTGFRISVVADALDTGQIRLYANCHIASWDATEPELKELREYLDDEWGMDLKEACQEFFALDSFPENEDLAFIYTGVIEGVDVGS